MGLKSLNCSFWRFLWGINTKIRFKLSHFTPTLNENKAFLKERQKGLLSLIEPKPLKSLALIGFYRFL
ncbi:hypothetical protein JP0087_09960 [Helicobacter pylori]|nr:hypothetical protein JP0087_09960 [Helicobacter pylori]